MFKIDDAEWTLDLRREGAAPERLYKGPPQDEKADITLTCSDTNFAALVMGKLNPQTVRLRIINDCHACMQSQYCCACMRLLVTTHQWASRFFHVRLAALLMLKLIRLWSLHIMAVTVTVIHTCPPHCPTSSHPHCQAFLMRKLKIDGSMGMAMKLQPILDAAQPRSKL